MAKSISKKALRDKADKLWSQVIRSVGYCQACGRSTALNAHHIYSKNNFSTRYDLDNGICLCSYCHTFNPVCSAHNDGEAVFNNWIKDKIGHERHDRITNRAFNITVKTTENWYKEQIEILKSIIQDMESGIIPESLNYNDIPSPKCIRKT